MKVKRIIKGSIYLFPLICVFVTALASSFLRLNNNFPQLIKETNGNTTTTYSYSGGFSDETMNPIYVGMDVFSSQICSDIDGTFVSTIYALLGNFQLVENDGILINFISDLIAYEMVAIMICAVLDVIFFVPELFYKFEDESILSRRKKRR